MDNYEFWKQEGDNNIVPHGFGEFPEGWDVKETLRELADSTQYQSVIDFGCGYGRLCESFDKDKYLGLDINENVVSKAKQTFTDYRFEVLQEGTKTADLYVAYTVFLHMTDREIHEALKRMRCRHLIVGEILGREWRRDGLPPVYNRDLKEYIHICRSHDLILEKHIKKPYERYAQTDLYRGRNTDLSLLIFRKCSRKAVL